VRRHGRAFTLIELLVVMGIIGILIALLFPAVGGVLASMDELRCENNLGQLAKVVVAYCQQYDGFFPMAYVRSAPISANHWLYVSERSNIDFDKGILVRCKLIPGHDQKRDRPDDPTSPLKIADPVYEGGSRIFYCPKDLKGGLPRKAGALEIDTNTDAKRGPTSYVINGSVTYGDYASWTTDAQTKVRSRRIGDFNSGDFLFIEQSSGVDPEPSSDFDCAFMVPNSGKYALTNRHRDGGFVSCMDGHVEWMSTEDFRIGMEKVGSDSTWYTKTFSRPQGETEGKLTAEEIASRWNPG
jgi:prepilin-type N-terminal cleavage/methylation domain-containing protein